MGGLEGLAVHLSKSLTVELLSWLPPVAKGCSRTKGLIPKIVKEMPATKNSSTSLRNGAMTMMDERKPLKDMKVP